MFLSSSAEMMTSKQIYIEHILYKSFHFQGILISCILHPIQHMLPHIQVKCYSGFIITLMLLVIKATSSQAEVKETHFMEMQ